MRRVHIVCAMALAVVDARTYAEELREEAPRFTGPIREAILVEAFAQLRDLATRRADRINAFEVYRQERDPSGIFSNQFVAALLGHPNLAVR